MLPGKKAAKGFPLPTDVERAVEGPVRGAKRGGLTDHLSGYHQIPNVGREAMVPGECVRRRPRPKAKQQPKAHQPPKPEELRRLAEKLKKKEKKPRRERSRSRNRNRSRSASKDRHGRSSSSSPGHGAVDEASEEQDVEKTAQELKQEEMEQRRRAAVEEESRKRLEEEQKKLKELEDVRTKKEEMNASRKSKLGGLFALTEDDINAEEDDEANRARIAKEKARIERKAQAQERAEATRSSYFESAVTRSSESSSTLMVDPNAAGNLTAADLDGRMHDHKFSKVWQDWDANKKNDPGEIARQFMKIAAIKRRGYAPGGGPGGSGGRSRSRSPTRRSSPPRGSAGGRRPDRR